MTDIDNVQTIVETARLSATPAELEPGKIYAFNTPTGVHEVDLSGPAFTGVPSRKQGTTLVRDAVSFHAYYDKHHDENTEVFADAERLTVTAILDAHTADTARWSGHRLALSLRQTDAWKQWLAYDGKLMAQEPFAEFLEDHLPELIEPTAADMLEIAQSIQGATKAEFQAGTRLATGQRQLSYVETTTAKAGSKGQLTIPETFTIGLVPFEGSEGYKLTARLRYRIERGGELRIGYKLERPGDIQRTAFADVVKAIAEQIDQPIMNGACA
ncbi:DUF2303 family protein [Streptomyces violascens]|uniref:DUF2303 family protein n=1 Tax=Streptomyces violascens TaxID=67381 RepID=A0ABQ3QX73_9ACTN|nr:DUF2303 family protein [Streptomyces violascens]GGU13012.1 hypothetical protein GCM10010289_38300 [Streptomyces violascens]GHI41880.1 hypothetical protein Sviol_62880 [Streptomyces violascens]